MAVCQNLVPLVNIKIAGKWMFIPLKMVYIVGSGKKKCVCQCLPTPVLKMDGGYPTRICEEYARMGLIEQDY